MQPARVVTLVHLVRHGVFRSKQKCSSRCHRRRQRSVLALQQQQHHLRLCSGINLAYHTGCSESRVASARLVCDPKASPCFWIRLQFYLSSRGSNSWPCSRLHHTSCYHYRRRFGDAGYGCHDSCSRCVRFIHWQVSFTHITRRHR